MDETKSLSRFSGFHSREKTAEAVESCRSTDHRKLVEAQRFRNILNMKMVSEKVDVSLPTTGMVEIIDRAVPGLRPVRPNKPLNIFLGACGGMLLALIVGGGAAWLTVRFRRRSKPVSHS